MAPSPRVLSDEPRIQRAFRITSSDLELLDLIRARYRLSSRVAALRFVLRWWKAKISEETGS